VKPRPYTRGLGSLDRLDRDDAAVPAVVAVPDDARDLREERVVLAAAHVVAGEELRAALPDEDRAARHELAAEGLDAEPLRVRVAAVAGRALSLFVCHGRPLPLPFDPVDAHLDDRLAVALRAPELLGPLFLEDEHLARADLVENRGLDRDAL